jgi:hypothetical protein
MTVGRRIDEWFLRRCRDRLAGSLGQEASIGDLRGVVLTFSILVFFVINIFVVAGIGSAASVSVVVGCIGTAMVSSKESSKIAFGL